MRCKFKVNRIERSMGYVSVPDPANPGKYKSAEQEMWTVKMSPVYGNGDPNHENTKFWQASPSGSFELNTVNKAAVDGLELGGEYYFDITPAAT